MKTYIMKTLALVFLSILGFTAAAEAQTMKNTLDARQKSIVAIAAFSGVGDLDNLKIALGQGLDGGLSINEIKEMLVQVYAYAGSPRSLNAVSTFRDVLDERKAKGISDVEGKAASPLPTDRTSLEFGTENQTKLLGQPISGGIFDFAPVLDQFLKAHLFGDIFQRDNFDWKSRELLTIGILSGIRGADPQLEAHLAIGMHNGIRVDEIRSAAAVIGDSLGQQYGEYVNRLFDSVLKKQGT